MTALLIDRRFRHVGRIARSSGSADPAVRDHMIGVLESWQETGKISQLRAFRDGKIGPNDLLGLSVDEAEGLGVRVGVQRTPECVYAIHRPDTNEVKIGMAVDVRRRLRQLQQANAGLLVLLGSMPGGCTEEAITHARFAEYRIRGEWYHGAPDLIEWARKLK